MNEPRTKTVPPAKGGRTEATEPADEVKDLVRRARAGEDDAFAEIFRRFRDKVYRISFRFTRDHDDAMDLTQTAFIKVHRSLDSYREESSFATWIARIATNTGIDLVRSRKRQAKVDLDDAPELQQIDIADAGQGGPKLSPAATLANRELGEALQAAMDELSDKHRAVFVLHCVDGMPYKEIAKTLDIAIGTVMSRLFHARRYLRRSLEPYLGEARVKTLLGESPDAREES